MKTKVMALFAIFVMAIAVAGTAYAAWTDQNTVSTVAMTGKFDMAVSGTLQSDNSQWVTPTVGPGSVPSDNNFVTVQASNVFGGYSLTVAVTLHNVGTLPAIINSVNTIVSPPIGGSASDVTVAYGGSNPPTVGDVISPGASQTFTLTITFGDSTINEANKVYLIVDTYSFGIAP